MIESASESGGDSPPLPSMKPKKRSDNKKETINNNCGTPTKIDNTKNNNCNMFIIQQFRACVIGAQDSQW